MDDTDGDEPDRLDEAWCLFDDIMIDDELRALWARFKPGVRIVMFSDSCHSGTMAREIALKASPTRDLGEKDNPLVSHEILMSAQEKTNEETGEDVMFRLLPEEAVNALRRDPAEFTARINSFRGNASIPLSAIKASVLSVSGCADNQLSSDLANNGAFTAAVKALLDGSRNYHELGKTVGVKIAKFHQTPNVESFGTVNGDFLDEPPLTI